MYAQGFQVFLLFFFTLQTIQLVILVCHSLYCHCYHFHLRQPCRRSCTKTSKSVKYVIKLVKIVIVWFSSLFSTTILYCSESIIGVYIYIDIYIYKFTGEVSYQVITSQDTPSPIEVGRFLIRYNLCLTQYNTLASCMRATCSTTNIQRHKYPITLYF